MLKNLADSPPILIIVPPEMSGLACENVWVRERSGNCPLMRSELQVHSEHEFPHRAPKQMAAQAYLHRSMSFCLTIRELPEIIRDAASGDLLICGTGLGAIPVD
jgi:hypothetical protein